MARLLIPTRNRPASLARVLGFLARFYPDARVTIASGSDPAYAERYAAAVDGAGGALEIDYRAYDPRIGLFDRVLDALRGIEEPLVVMGADDDYPMLDALDQGAAFLLAHDDYVTALGAMAHLDLESDGRLTARLSPARPIEADSAARRALRFAEWGFSTTYAVTRRAHLIERYERARTLFLPRFFDFLVGAHDSIAGKVKALPELGYVCTRNFRHSYLRPEDGLIFLRRAEDVLRIAAQLRDDLAGSGDALPPEEAERVAERLVRRRIEAIVGAAAHRRPGFAESELFTEPPVQAQYALFHDLFTEGAAARARFSERLMHIGRALQDAALAEDNLGEERSYESLEQQIGG